MFCSLNFIHTRCSAYVCVTTIYCFFSCKVNMLHFFVCGIRDVKIVKCKFFRLGQRYKFTNKDTHCLHDSLLSDVYV
jgi:hypothetical protein